MKLSLIQEPLLEFATGSHLDPRAGIARFGVYDVRLPIRRERILVGAVGTSDALSKFSTWLIRCSKSIPAKPDSRQPNLFLDFCGFRKDMGFRADFLYTESLSRSLSLSELKRIARISNWNERIDAAVEAYFQHVKFLAQNRTVDVVVCLIPEPLYAKIAIEEQEPVESDMNTEAIKPNDLGESNFRRSLKASTMHLGKPIQLLRELSLESNPKTQQDDATKAWNFCTAIYYKASHTIPWKLISNVDRPSVCFVGIGFYRSRDRKVLQTSLAQIFDEMGNGVILRGTPVEMNKEDRVPHLSEEQSMELLQRAIAEYEIALQTVPARLVIHKSSNYSAEEMSGFQAAVTEKRIQAADYISIQETKLRLVREGIYPPYRGTHLDFDGTTHLLYTRGAVAYYRTYPGRYVPQPLEVRIVSSDESPGQVCKEILGLTKLNWNHTQFDGKYPITIECARKVGQIMKYVKEGENPQIRYSFYM